MTGDTKRVAALTSRNATPTGRAVPDAARAAREARDREEKRIEKLARDTKVAASRLEVAAIYWGDGAPLTTRARLTEACAVLARVVASIDDVAWADGYKRPRKPRRESQSRAARFQRAVEAAQNAVNELKDIQGEYESWRDNLPENLQGSALGEQLDAIADADIDSIASALDELKAFDLPTPFKGA